MAADQPWSEGERRFDPAHPAAEGHFPGNPIIPGAVLLDEIRAALAAEGTPELCGIRAVKFLAPVRPGDRLRIRWRKTAALEIKFEATHEDGGLALLGSFTLTGAP